MIISSRLFGAFLECSTKCWLRSIEPGTNNSYVDWVNQRNEAYLESRLRHSFVGIPESDRATAPTIPNDPKDADWRLAINAHWITKHLESRLQAVERIPAKGVCKHSQFIPYRFEFVNKLTKEHKLLLAFDALLLSEVLGREVSFGRIVHGDSHNSLKVKTHTFAAEVRKRIKQITALLTFQSAPDLVLNRHCGQCAYRTQCSARAKETDELSLLSGISQNDRKNFRARGIFTVTQLSYTFRPRHRRKNSSDSPEKNHHSLRALAIRENKIHAVGTPKLELAGTLVFLDVEGLPDRDFYYLIGIRIQAAKENIQHSFWANDLNGEALIWQQFLGVLSEIPDPHLIHYGSYESKFLKRMGDRHGRPPTGSIVAAAIDHPTNLLSFIYAKIYFPTHSNGLKEIAAYLGFNWSGPVTSGIDSVVWRHAWEESKDSALRKNLEDYNRQDCEALDLLANKLIDLSIGFQNRASSATGEVALTSNMKGRESYRFKRNEFVFPEMEDINQAAYWDYQRERVYVRSPDKPPSKRRGHPTHRRLMKPNTTIEYSRPPSCPSCKSTTIYMHGIRSRIVIDLRFMRHGIKRWVIRHIGRRYRCPRCGSIIHPHDRPTIGSRFGPNLVAYTIYQNIELRLPQNRVALSANKIFGLDISRNTVNRFKTSAAKTYEDTYRQLLKRLCSGRLLHVDETNVGVMGKEGYVWVLTSLNEVAYFFTPTRSGETIQSMLKEYSGVMVTDFYAAYDTISCPQQKCLIHFIRDLNEELLKFPYDDELKQLVGDFSRLLKPIIETVDARGLKKRFFGKHRILVDRFYRRLDAEWSSEPARKIAERLRKNRNTMFTFLNFDDVPWNNNNAEHAIKAFAALRRAFEGTTTEKGLREFLILLSLCETCKYKGLDFLDFLRSGSKDIDDFVNNGVNSVAGQINRSTNNRAMVATVSHS